MTRPTCTASLPTNSEKNGIAVIVSGVGWGDYESKFQTSMAAGMPPDVGTTTLGGSFEYGKESNATNAFQNL